MTRTPLCTDHIDAYLLAKLGRSDLADLRPLLPDMPVIQELKELTRDQEHLIQTQTRLVNQFTACLKAYYPVALSLFAKLQQRSTLRFLQAYPVYGEGLVTATLHVFPALHPPLLCSPHPLTMHKCGRNVSALRVTMGSRQREISDCMTFNAGRNRWLTNFG